MRIELEQVIKDYTDKLSAVRWRHGSELQRATAAGTIAAWWRRRRATNALREVHSSHAGLHAVRQARHDEMLTQLQEYEDALASAAEQSVAWQAEVEDVQATAGELLHELELENAALVAAAEAAEMRAASAAENAAAASLADNPELERERTRRTEAETALQQLESRCLQECLEAADQASYAQAKACQMEVDYEAALLANAAAGHALVVEHTAEKRLLQTNLAEATAVCLFSLPCILLAVYPCALLFSLNVRVSSVNATNEIRVQRQNDTVSRPCRQ